MLTGEPMAATPLDMRITRFNRTLPARAIIAMGKVIGYLLPVRNRSSLFFFFPFQHVGGAEKVHAEIVGCFAGEKPWVFFTKRSENAKFRPMFGAGARLLNIWPLLKYGYPLSVGIVAGLINRHEKPVVFGSNSLFYYLLLPYLGPNVRRTDLLHAFGGGPEEYSLPVAAELDARVVISSKTGEHLKAQYRAANAAPVLADRIVLIENRVEIPESATRKRPGEKLRVLFVGRGAAEKRVHLIGKAATLCGQKKVAAEFILVGDVAHALDDADRPSCQIIGEISGTAELDRIYKRADILVLTSSREGFPMVVMEAMAHGAVPVCTAVGGIPVHVKHGVNGLLLADGSEERVVEELVATVERLANHRELLAELSQAAFAYAREHFGGENFCAAYRQVITGSRDQGVSCPR